VPTLRLPVTNLPSLPPSRLSICLGIALATLATSSAAAPPDAGSLLRDELRRDQPAGPVMPPKPEAMADKPPVKDAGAKASATVMVMGFRLNGLSALQEEDAQAILRPYIGQTMAIDGMHRVAEKLEAWIRAQGLFAARAYVPPQELKDGIVQIQVIEGKVDGIDVKRAPETRLPESVFRNTMTQALPPGTPLHQEKLERGLLILNDLPATSSRAVLAPGKEMGASRVVIEAAQGPIMIGSAELDNTGGRFTGDWRAGGGVTLNDPYGFGDQWSLRGSTSRGSSFGRVAYSAPLGTDGWKGGAALIESRYKLCCDSSVTALGSSGEASALSGFVSYPVIRTRMKNLSVTGNLASREFINHSPDSEKKTRTQGLAIAGDWSDMTGFFGQGAFTTYSLQWTRGKALTNDPADPTTSKTAGHFDKWGGQLTHLLRFSNTAAIYAGLTTQWAGKNLDSSEKFALGGPQGVRAYPGGEGSGDEAWLLNLEWRQELERDWRVVGFVDVGEVTLRRNPFTPGLMNRYMLSGGGATLAWTPVPGSQVSATVASRFGNNPARDATGRDSDNRPARTQLWLQGSANF
jgi:hemolysin activation/secretion protein